MLAGSDASYTGTAIWSDWHILVGILIADRSLMQHDAMARLGSDHPSDLQRDGNASVILIQRYTVLRHFWEKNDNAAIKVDVLHHDSITQTGFRWTRSCPWPHSHSLWYACSVVRFMGTVSSQLGYIWNINPKLIYWSSIYRVLQLNLVDWISSHVSREHIPRFICVCT